jgi:hypothetical protein
LSTRTMQSPVVVAGRVIPACVLFAGREASFRFGDFLPHAFPLPQQVNLWSIA